MTTTNFASFVLKLAPTYWQPSRGSLVYFDSVVFFVSIIGGFTNHPGQEAPSHPVNRRAGTARCARSRTSPDKSESDEVDSPQCVEVHTSEPLDNLVRCNPPHPGVETVLRQVVRLYTWMNSLDVSTDQNEYWNDSGCPGADHRLRHRQACP